MWRKKLAVIFQNAYIFSGTVAENVAMGKLNAAEEQVQKQMRFVKIDDMAQKAISYGANELSGGEKQRIAVARAALKDSEIILMDEGDNHLDAEGKKILFNYLKQTDQTVIFISHDFIKNRIIKLLKVAKTQHFTLLSKMKLKNSMAVDFSILTCKMNCVKVSDC